MVERVNTSITEKNLCKTNNGKMALVEFWHALRLRWSDTCRFVGRRARDVWHKIEDFWEWFKPEPGVVTAPPLTLRQIVYGTIGTIILVGMTYIVFATFSVVNGFWRAVTGISLQLVAALALAVDQVVHNFPAEFKDSWIRRFGRAPFRAFITVCLVSMLIIVFVVLSQSSKVTLASILSLFGGISFLLNIYGLSLVYILSFVRKHMPGNDQEKHDKVIIVSNVILLCLCVVIILVTGLIATRNPVTSTRLPFSLWWAAEAVLVVPSALLSSLFFAVLGLSNVAAKLADFLRQHRGAFWIGIFAVWFWGSLLLLMDLWTTHPR